jgi:hypothetical protein
MSFEPNAPLAVVPTITALGEPAYLVRHVVDGRPAAAQLSGPVGASALSAPHVVALLGDLLRPGWETLSKPVRPFFPQGATVMRRRVFERESSWAGAVAGVWRVELCTPTPLDALSNPRADVSTWLDLHSLASV